MSDLTDHLKRVREEAGKVKPGRWEAADTQHIANCSPEFVAALIDVALAAVPYQDETRLRGHASPATRFQLDDALDALCAVIEKENADGE